MSPQKITLRPTSTLDCRAACGGHHRRLPPAPPGEAAVRRGPVPPPAGDLNAPNAFPEAGLGVDVATRPCVDVATRPCVRRCALVSRRDSGAAGRIGSNAAQHEKGAASHPPQLKTVQLDSNSASARSEPAAVGAGVTCPSSQPAMMPAKRRSCVTGVPAAACQVLPPGTPGD